MKFLMRPVDLPNSAIALVRDLRPATAPLTAIDPSATFSFPDLLLFLRLAASVYR